MMEKFINLRKSRWLLFMFIALLTGVSPAWADDVAATNFDGLEDNTLPTGWTIVGGTMGTEYEVSGTYKHGSEGKSLYAANGSSNSAFIVTPVLEGEISFYYANSSNAAGSIYIYEAIKDGDSYTTTGSALFSNTWSKVSYQRTPSWSLGSITLTSEKRLAIYLVKGAIDDFAGTLYVEASCPKPKALTATDITDESAVLGWTSGADTWNLQYKAEGDANYTAINGITDNPYTLTGLDAGTNYTFQVQAVCSIEDTSDWSSAGSFTTLLCNASAQRNISYSLTDSYGDGWSGAKIQIVDASSNIVIQELTITSGGKSAPIEGTVALCPNRAYNFIWVASGGNYDYECGFVIKDVDGNVLFTEETGSPAPTAGLIGAYSWDNTPVGDGAKFAIDQNAYDFGIKNLNDAAEQKFTVTNNGNANLTVSFASDNAEFSVPNYVLFTDVLGWGTVNVHYWGGETSTTWPGVAMTEIGTNEYSQKQFRAIIPTDATSIIFNNGNGTQTIDLAYANGTEGYYTINEQEDGKYKAGSWNNGPGWNVAAGESREFTVVMNTATAGVKSGNITLSYTAVNGTETVIPVCGTVMAAGTEVVDFNTAIPARWDNQDNGWSLDNGAAKCTTKKNLTTQKLDFSSETSPFFIMKVKASDSGSGDYVTIEGSSDNGATWTAFDMITKSYNNGDFGALSGDYTSIVVSIPNTVNKLRFNGYYVLIDEIAGLKYSDNDPVMGIYTDAECTAANKVAATTEDNELGFISEAPTAITYYIKNDGTGTLELSLSDELKGFTAAIGGTSITAGNSTTLVLTPVADYKGYFGGNATVTATGLGTFTVNVSGVLPVDGKLNLNFATDNIPATWTTNNWEKNTNGYVEVGYSSSTMQTSTLVASANEDIVVEAKQTYSSSSYSFGVKYRAAGSEDEWVDLIPAANIGTSYVMLHGTITTAGNYELQFTGNYTQIQRIYGMSKPEAPEMMVYDGASVTSGSFGFGKVTDENDATHEFTVKNEGLAKLTGLAATLGGDNADHYTVAITGATGDNNDEIAAGESATVTVTQLKDNLGTHSATLTISANSLDSKVITLSGTTVDHTILNVDFDTSSEWPAEILEHGANWSVYNYNGSGEARQGNYSTASSLILTPLTVTNITDKLTFDVAYYNYSSYRELTVSYTTDGGLTWKDYNWGTEETPVTDMKESIGYSYPANPFEVTGIAAGTAAFKFTGKCIKLDNIAGDMKVTSAPLVSFATVSDNISGANLSADGVATYTLANNGNADYVGTVAATNVTVGVTGEDVTFESNTLTIPVGKTATITATMAFAAPYGAKNGSLAITSESWVGDINESYTATLVDPTDFVEDFAANAKPAGWYSEGWTYSDGVASVNSGVEKPMITEKIGAEAGKNTLTFDAWTTGENQTLNVYTSPDRKNWTQLGEAIALTSESTTYTRNLTNGDQYIKFGGAVAKVDNIKGVKKLEAPAHDLFEVSNTMAATGIPGASYTATVVGVSLRADETVTAELWVKKEGEAGIKVAYLENEAMTVNTNKTFTLTGNLPTEEGEYKMWVTVKNSDNSAWFNTNEIDFTLAHTQTMAITAFPNAAAVQADDNNEFEATFNVTVQNTGSKALAANEVSVSLIDNADDTNVFTNSLANTLFLETSNGTVDISVDAKLGVWMWGVSAGEWAEFNKVRDGFYSVDLKGNTSYIVVRQDPAKDFSLDDCYNKTGDIAFADGNLRSFSSYYGDKDMILNAGTFSLTNGQTVPVQVTVSGTLTNGENASLAFKAKENLGNTYYGNGLTSSVSVTAAPVIVLDEETALTEVATGQNRKVSLAHKFVEGWNTICVPFEISDLSVFGDGAVAYSFDEYNTGTKELTFNKVDFENSGKLEAGKPYVIYVPAAINSALTFTGITFTEATPAAGASTYNGLSFQGTYAPVTFSEIDGDQWGLTAAGKIAKARATATMKGFRGYFTGVDLNGARVAFFGDESTGIRTITVDGNAVEGTYNLQGQKVETLKQGGLYIINGKKVVVK